MVVPTLPWRGSEPELQARHAGLAVKVTASLPDCGGVGPRVPDARVCPQSPPGSDPNYWLVFQSSQQSSKIHPQPRVLLGFSCLTAPRSGSHTWCRRQKGQGAMYRHQERAPKPVLEKWGFPSQNTPALGQEGIEWVLGGDWDLNAAPPPRCACLTSSSFICTMGTVRACLVSF